MTKYEKYKIALLGTFVVGFLLCFYKYSENGRYSFPKGGSERNALLLIDTRTGEIYNFGSLIKTDLKKYKRVK